MSRKQDGRASFLVRRTLLLALILCCVLGPVAVAVVNGFVPGLGQHAAQSQPFAVPTEPLTAPPQPIAAGGPAPQPALGHGYQTTPASETIFTRLGLPGLAALAGAAVALTGLAFLRRRRSARPDLRAER